MCLFITALVPRTTHSAAFDAVVSKHRLSFAACENRHLKAQLRSSERYVYATAAHCDCGSPLFFGSEAPSAESVAREVAKLRRKKWSEAKIEKWLAATSPRPYDPNLSPSGHRSASEWAAFLEEALRVPKLPYLGLVGHWYDGNVATEEFKLSGRVRHSVAELQSGQLGILERDVIHEFRLEE